MPDESNTYICRVPRISNIIKSIFISGPRRSPRRSPWDGSRNRQCHQSNQYSPRHWSMYNEDIDIALMPWIVCLLLIKGNDCKKSEKLQYLVKIEWPKCKRKTKKRRVIEMESLQLTPLSTPSVSQPGTSVNWKQNLYVYINLKGMFYEIYKCKYFLVTLRLCG